jgi:patatin-like phospholipase/acyl hydrolase
MRPQNKGLSVLSLDGGGVRGTISLLVLKNLLRLLQPEGDIFPYLYFDVICGTSTGGLISILLGVLHLDIDTALMLYQKLSKKVFHKGYSRVRYLVKDAGYDRKPLERAIMKILKERGKGRTFMEDPERDRGCYVSRYTRFSEHLADSVQSFVTTAHCIGQRRDVLPIRSYRHVGDTESIPVGYRWTVLDAALATSAAPGYFNRYYVDMNGHRFGFEDAGAHRVNNPTELAWKVCRELNADRNSLFISLGTGSSDASIDHAPGLLGLFRNKETAVKASARHVTNVDDVHDQMEERTRMKGSNMYVPVVGVVERDLISHFQILLSSVSSSTWTDRPR